VDRVKKVWDVNPTLGGPIKQDKLWFFMGYRNWGNDRYVGGNFYNLTPAPSFVYTPDLSRQAVDDNWNDDITTRLTWQANPKNKFSLLAEWQKRCGCHWAISSLIAPEAAPYQPLDSPGTYQLTWTTPLTNRLLLDVGGTQYWGEWKTQPKVEEGADWQTIGVTELSTGYLYRARGPLNSVSIGQGYQRMITHQHNYRAALSYVTGSHALKFGTTFWHGKAWVDNFGPDERYGFRNGLPQSVSLVAFPYTYQTHINAILGLFAQDQWTLRKWTINAGLRFDYHNTSIPPQGAGPGQFVPNRNLSLPEIKDVPNWKDLSPRVGVAYDLFGNAKTAVKASLSKFLLTQTNALAFAVNPLNAPSQIVNRTWNDRFFPVGDPRRDNLVPDCALLNPDANDECGPFNNRAFGTAAGAQQIAPDVTKGFGVRTYNWETSVSVQHELRPGASVSAGYYRRWFGNLTTVDNLATTASDFDTFCLTAPTDARLPGGGGNQICGLYDINPAKFGQVNNITVKSSSLGKQTEVYNGFDLTMNTRLKNGILLQGGYNIGRIATDNCDIVGNAAGSAGNLTAVPSKRFCAITPKFLTQVKLQGAYPLPWTTMVSATFQALPGPEKTALWQAPNTAIAPGLGRNLASGSNGVSVVQLMEPGQTYGPRVYQIDTRLAKNLKFGRYRLQGTVDVYNLLNASPVLSLNNTFGPSWQIPTVTLPARFVKFGGKIDF
jgi:hypothetical protein